MTDRTATANRDGCRAGWCAGEDWCAVTCAMDVLGNKWHPVIVHRLLSADALRFTDLSADIGDVTNKMLSQSLDDLEAEGVVERTVVEEKPVTVEYSLTEYGRTLEPVIDALETWGRARLDRTGNPDASC